VVDGAYMEYAKAKDSAYSIEPKDILRYKNVIYTAHFFLKRLYWGLKGWGYWKEGLGLLGLIRPGIRKGSLILKKETSPIKIKGTQPFYYLRDSLFLP